MPKMDLSWWLSCLTLFALSGRCEDLVCLGYSCLVHYFPYWLPVLLCLHSLCLLAASSLYRFNSLTPNAFTLPFLIRSTLLDSAALYLAKSDALNFFSLSLSSFSFCCRFCLHSFLYSKQNKAELSKVTTYGQTAFTPWFTPNRHNWHVTHVTFLAKTHFIKWNNALNVV